MTGGVRMQKLTEREIRTAYRKITETLIEKNLTVTTMESCTSGLIASLITDTEGASGVMKGAFVTYSNEAKIKQGVPKETIEQYSVYSEETAAEMAKACRRAYGADFGIGVTGTTGNVDPANADASVPGRVFFAIDSEKGTETFYRELPPLPERYDYKLAVAAEIAEEFIKRI